jgi:hypothetical protein
MEAYHPDRTDNEVIRLDLAGSGFLRLLRALRVVLLQDSVILRQRFASHPLWTDPLFNSEEYRRFAARVEDSLVDVVTPDELTMQKYWPAHDAVAKLRHEAAISEIKTSGRESVSEIVRSITDRLDTMERSSAAASFTPSIPPPAPPAPVWVQQGLGRVYRVYTTVYGRVWVYSGSLVGARGTLFSVDDAGRRGSGQSFPFVPPTLRNLSLRVVRGLITLIVFINRQPRRSFSTHRRRRRNIGSSLGIGFSLAFTGFFLVYRLRGFSLLYTVTATTPFSIYSDLI